MRIEIFGSSAVIQEYKDEFRNRLSHREIEPLYKTYEELSHQLLSKYFEASLMEENEPDFSVDEVTSAINTLKNGKACGTDFIPAEVLLNAGTNLIEVIKNVMNTIKNTIETPKEWISVIISTIYKNKGARKELVNHRGIFITNVLSKVMEKLIKTRIEIYTSTVNKLQAGSRKDRSTCDNVFIMNSLIDHALYLKSSLYLTFYDYATCFDILWLEDCLLSLWKIGATQTPVLSYITFPFPLFVCMCV